MRVPNGRTEARPAGSGRNNRSHAEVVDQAGRAECGDCWQLICDIYRDLTNLELPETMPLREWRRVDYVLKVGNSRPRIIEIDETQHFNCFRARTLRLYLPHIPVAFDRKTWIAQSEAKINLELGGFAVPKPPLFPGDGGRHRQRAFRDALCDILPPQYDFLPTLRIAKFDVNDWMKAPDACDRMQGLLNRKFQAERRAVSDPTIHHGDPCIKGTRVPVSVIAGSIADGDTPEQLLAAYPQLTIDDIRAALKFAANDVG